MGCSASSPGPIQVKSAAPVLTPDEYGEYPSGEGIQYWTTDPNVTKDIIFSKVGTASADKVPAMTIHTILEKCVARIGDKPALKVERPCPPLNADKTAPPSAPLDQWKTWTYKEYVADCHKAAKGFIHLGMKPKQSVNILGFNSPEWFMCQLGAAIASGMAAGLYPTDTTEQLQFKSRHSGAAVVCVDTKENFDKIKSLVNELPDLKAIVVWGDTPDVEEITRAEDGENNIPNTVKVLTWEKLLTLATEEDTAELDTRMAAQKPGDCATLIYTSGTTGNPKAVMISHDNLIFVSFSVLQMIGVVGYEETQERLLSYLPLSHIAGLMVDIICPLVVGALMKGHSTACFARPYDLRAGTFGDRLRTVRPTLFLGVPRVWEKIAEKLKAVGAQTKGLKKKIATWAKAKASEYQTNLQLGGNGQQPSHYGFASEKVLSKIKLALGLDACKFSFTGAAPMTKETLNYFGSLGININEFYGMSESTAAATGSSDDCHIWGSIGYATPGVEVKVFNVNETDMNQKTECKPVGDLFDLTGAQQGDEFQGEICFRGRNIMLGYMANPALGQEHIDEIEGKNRAAIDSEGWLHSGDKGCMNKAGFFRITGRYKELIIGAGGENVAPVPIEDSFKAFAPAVANIVMIGDHRKYNVALVTLKAQGATGELPGSDDLDGAALDVDPACKTISAAIKSEKFIKYLEDALKNTNADGKAVISNAAKIQKFTILPHDLSVTGGELTPTLKVKRSVVAEIHADAIEAMYDPANKSVFVPYAGSATAKPSVAAATEKKAEGEDAKKTAEENKEEPITKTAEDDKAEPAPAAEEEVVAKSDPAAATDAVKTADVNVDAAAAPTETAA